MSTPPELPAQPLEPLASEILELFRKMAADIAVIRAATEHALVSGVPVVKLP